MGAERFLVDRRNRLLLVTAIICSFLLAGCTTASEPPPEIEVPAEGKGDQLKGLEATVEARVKQEQKRA